MVHHAGCQQQAARPAGLVLAQGDRELLARTMGVLHDVLYEPYAAVGSELFPRGGEKRLRRNAVASEEAMHTAGESIALATFVHDEDVAAASAEYQRGAEAGRPPAHDDCIPDLTHGSVPLTSLGSRVDVSDGYRAAPFMPRHAGT